MAKLLSVIKLIQARCTQLQPCRYPCGFKTILDERLPLCVVGRAGDEHRQGHSARNNGQSLSAGGPNIHESVGASKDARPSA